jgi:hypothetical protein
MLLFPQNLSEFIFILFLIETLNEMDFPDDPVFETTNKSNYSFRFIRVINTKF